MSENNNKLIVILGQTASGKTDLSIKLAKKLGGVEIVSADSRQVYKGLNVGSGKITRKEMAGIPHHLLDVANPKKRFSVSQYQKLATQAIKKIHAKNKTPFLVGGTGFYIQSVVDGISIPEVSPNPKLRKQLEKKSTQELFLMLKKLDPARAKNIDAKNPVRLIRAIEINLETGSPVPKLSREALAKWDVLQIGIKKSPKELKILIQKRLKKRIKGIILEVQSLHSNRRLTQIQRGLTRIRKSPSSLRAKRGNPGLSWKRLEELGLEYKFVAQYIQNKISYQEMVDKIQKESEQFAKRQMTWFSAHGGSASGGKRDSRIHWVKNQQQAEKLIKKFLS